MPSINLVDLNGQHERIRDELDQAIREVVDSGKFINGPQVTEFEHDLAEYLEVKEAIGCANGTDALQLALMALELPANSEIIVPDFTFVATAEVVKHLGMTPVLVDVDPDTFLIDPKDVESAITENTHAIMPVHLFGQCAQMEELLTIAKKHNLYLIEDVAQALGAEYDLEEGTYKAGTMGTIGCTSFFPVKNLGAMGDAGALFTNDNKLAEKIRVIKQHGMATPYYYSHVGVNSRLDTIQAAILKVKLPYLDRYNKLRQKVASEYDKALDNDNNIVQVPKRMENSTHVFQQYTLKVENGYRDQLKSELEKAGIPSKVFYPTGIHEQAVYADERSVRQELEHSLEVSRQVLSLPLHTELTQEEIDYIIGTIKEFATKQVTS